MKDEDGSTYKSHGAVDWKEGKPGEARKLNKANANGPKDGRPETWHNAESISASATEMKAMEVCDDEDVGV